MALAYFLSALVGYFLGSLPTGYLVGRSRGIDIREHGSGNIGATNVVRVLGKKPGYFVFFCDAFKGWLAVWLGILIANFLLIRELNATDGFRLPYSFEGLRDSSHPIVGIIAALACIIGHNFPVWLKFKGGKGVATTVGVLLGLMPAAIGVAAVIWVACFYLSRYVSLASILGAASLPLTVWLLTNRRGNPGLHDPLLWFSVAAVALIFWRHRTNITRLLNGTETRFERRAKPTPPAS